MDSTSIGADAGLALAAFGSWGRSKFSFWHGLAFLLGFYGSFISLLLILAAIFHQARQLDQRIVRSMLLVSIVILIACGALLIRSGLTS
jgi:hypothetical protein